MNMKFKRLVLVLVVVLMASTLAPALAKSPFADVPGDHWAYDSIVELAAAGLIEGYPDGTFSGSRMMTRYEAAMVFARALTRLESQIGDIDVLPELDKIKAELVAEIKAQLAELDKPVVETKVIEKVIVDKDVDEAALARIRANEIATEALQGDAAYLENRVLGLVDGIRYDMNKLQEQLDEPVAEQPSMEEIEALIAQKVQEGVLEAALGAKEVVRETTIVEKMVSTTPELTEEDVELIAQAMISQQLQQYELLIARALRESAENAQRLDALEAVQADYATKTELAEVKAAVDRMKFGGALEFKAENKESDATYKLTQTADLNLTVKASDSVTVKSFLSAKVDAHTKTFDLTKYGLEVKSESPIKRLVVGTVDKKEVRSRFSSYVLDNTDYKFAGLADLDIIEGLTGNVLLAQKTAASDPVTAAFGLSYKLMPELGVKVSAVASKPAGTRPGIPAVGAGIFGEIAKIKYAGDFAMDRAGGTDENMLFGVSLETTLGPVTLDGEYIMAGDNYQVGRPFEELTTQNSIEAGAKVEFLGIDLGGRYYREADATATVVSAYKLDASKGFDLFVPIKVSANYTFNDTNTVEKTHALAKLAIEPEEPALGLHYGASATYVQNEYNKDGNWKNADFSGKDFAIVAGNLKYKVDLRGALVDLGYGANYKMALGDDPKDDPVLTHKVDLGYGFTQDVKLTLGGTIKQTFEDPVANAFTYNAGLKFKF